MKLNKTFTVSSLLLLISMGGCQKGTTASNAQDTSNKALKISSLNTSATLPAALTTFVHPGILHSKVDLDRMKTNINTEPWLTAYNNFKAKPTASLNYTMQGPFAQVSRNPDTGNTQLQNDSQACWDLAIMWYLTGNASYKTKAIQIMNAWSSTLTSIVGKDAQLAAGDNGIKFANGAEIIRYTSTGWASADITKFQNMLENVFYPQVQNIGDANWGGSCMKTIISIGVFCNDAAKFNYAVDNFNNNACASLTTNISATGQCSESGRDQPHALGNINNLAMVAEVAWTQGVDLYSSNSSRILAGFEYWCKYNLGNTVPYDPAFHRCTMGPWSVISPTGRGIIQWAPVEMIYAAYRNRLHNSGVTYTQQFRSQLTNADMTLFFRILPQ